MKVQLARLFSVLRVALFTGYYTLLILHGTEY